MVYIVAMFTVKQLASLAGVTPRTIHHYDAIGLLKPVRVGKNGYRYYDDESILRLQQILFYRELDLPLLEIKKIMGRRDFVVLSALEGHRLELEKRIARLERLLGTGDNTILAVEHNLLIQILLGRGRAPTSAEKAKIFWFFRVHPRKSASNWGSLRA